MHVVGFNGPPESGKDRIANRLADMIDSGGYRIPVRVVSIVDTLARMGATLLGATYSDEWYTATKSVPQPLLRGETLRQWMIRQVEEFYKPRYGDDFWSRALIHNLRTSQFDGLVLVTNIGFQFEAELFCDTFGPDYFLLVSIERLGKDFKGDSRGWVTSECHSLHLFHHEDQTDVAAQMIFNAIESKLY